MLKNYFKTSWRHILKYKFHSLVNILGLAIGIAFTFLIGAYIWGELGVNAGLKHVERQYIIQSKWKDPNRGSELTTIGALPKALREEYPHLVANYYRWDGVTVIASYEENNFKQGCAIGDPTMFTMYGFELIHGDKRTALSKPYSAVMTEELAVKYFGKTDVVGKSLTIQNFSGQKQDFMVTGILKSIPQNSVTYLNENNHNQLFLSRKSIDFFGRNMDSWNNIYIAGYIELQPGVTPEMLEQPFKELLQKNTPALIHDNLLPYLAPLSTYYLAADNGLVKKMVYTLSFVAAFILLMAVVNFVNISVNNSTSRLKETGVRKVLGSFRKQLMAQYLTESVMLAGFATVLAIVIYQLFRPLFGNILEKEILSVFSFPLYFAAVPLMLSLFIGVLSGIYPALVLSSLQTVDSVKGKLQSAREKVALRKLLVGFQFCVATIVLTGAVIIGKQVSYFFSENLGYDKNYMIAAQLPRDWSADGVRRMETIRDVFTRLPEVENVSLSYEIPNGMHGGGDPVLYRQSEDSTQGVAAQLLMADELFAETYEIPLLAGQFFNKPGARYDSARVVISEATAKALRWDDAAQAVGQKVYIQGNPVPFMVSGVVKDFHFASMQEKIQPLIWMNVKLTNTYRYFSFRLRPGNIHAALNAVQSTWNELLPSAPFEYNFMDDTLKKLYRTEIQLKKASYVATSLSVVIVLLGILGLVSLSIQKRIKEIGVRKALGASVMNIISLFMKDFLRVFVAAVIIACPIAWYIMDQWLSGYHSRIDITGEPFILSVGTLALIIGLLIGIQTIKAALVNPVKSLRSE